MARMISLRRRLISPSMPSFPLLSSPQIFSEAVHPAERDSSAQSSMHERPVHTPFSFIFLNATPPPCTISQRRFFWWRNGTDPHADATVTGAVVGDDEAASEMESPGSNIQTALQALDGAGNAGEGGIVLETGARGIEWYTPVDGVVAFIDALHDVTGLPWWQTIVASTIAIRMALLPLTVLQLRKMDKISQLLPKLPPPIPMPGSGRSLRQQYSLFAQQRQAMGCPTFLWAFASFAVQAPCFISWMMAVRRMCLDHHPGFDCGGAFWFSDLTQFVHGPLGAIFPISVAGMHFLNVQISFGQFRHAKLSGFMFLIQKYYKIWLEFLTVPIFLAGFYVPQGTFMYWLTNSALTATQQLSLKQPYIRQKLGLRVGPKEQQMSFVPEIGNGESMDKLSSNELLVLASKHMANGQPDKAIEFLRAVIEKDPEKSEAYVALGKVQLLQKLWNEAGECFELAISKARNDDVLIAAYLGAGVALFSQGRKLEAIAHLRKLAAFEEPKEPWSKARYYQGMATLGSALFQEGNKVEAAQFLRLAAKYDPSINLFLRECEENAGH